ncbi:MAG TPA: M14-type cytosolic carboxypeptidase [Bryobacteraceae bacterium]
MRAPRWFLAFVAASIVAGTGVPLRAAVAVRTNFEGGNIGEVVVVSPTHLRCAVQGQADVDHRNRQADWYYFELTNLPREPVTIDLVNLAGEYNYRAPAFSVTKGTRPVYSLDDVSWTHFQDDQVQWDNQEPHLSIRFTPARDHLWIAHVPPYTNRHLAALLDGMRASPYLDRKAIGRTVKGRDMLLLTITNPTVAEEKKAVVWLMFRQHAWEAGSSWVGDGAIRFLLSGDTRAKAIRERTIFKIFPMADPDGVALGTVRYNQNGYDLNRNWDTIDAQKMPEIAAQHKSVMDWVDGGHRLDVFLSLHNTETGEYLETPRAFHKLGQRIFALLGDTTTFNPTVPLREVEETAARGRMAVDQGLLHDRKLPAMLMEQMIEYNSRLGHCPDVSDRKEFGAGLVRAFSEAVAAAGPGR